MNPEPLLPTGRFLATLHIVYREGVQLSYSWHRLYDQTIDQYWVEQLNQRPDQAEILEAFASRFGRMQDTIADKLLPRWLLALAERPGSQIETLNRAERLGVLENMEQWLQARKLRNLLVHEYIQSPASFSDYLQLAKEYSPLLLTTYNRLQSYSVTNMGIGDKALPEQLPLLVREQVF